MLTKAANQHDARAADRLGYLYLKGLGVEENRSKAKQLFAEAADSGDAWGLLHLGEMYELGDGVSAITKNRELAFQLFERSANKGNPEAAYRLARHYSEVNINSIPDYGKAAEYLRKSAAYGYYLGQRDLGRAFELGLGVAINLHRAYFWYSRADDQGDGIAYNYREALKQTMTTLQVSQAEAMFKRWQQAHESSVE